MPKLILAALLALDLAGAGTLSAAQARLREARISEDAPASEEGPASDQAPFSGEPMSKEASLVANWVRRSGDNHDLPFIVIDKIEAAVFVFDAEGQFLGATPALLGSAQGDDTAPGIGDRELSEIGPEDRTTPAGRFLAVFGPASGSQKVLWVDYETSVALHPVITGNKKEHRLERLRSPSPDDNRITFGCINISPLFYRNVVRTAFNDMGGVVYILPEDKPLDAVFPAFHLSRRQRLEAAVYGRPEDRQ